MNTMTQDNKPKLDLKSTVTFKTATFTEEDMDISAAVQHAGIFLASRTPFSVYSPSRDEMLFEYEGKVDAEGKNIFTGNAAIAKRFVNAHKLTIDFVTLLNKAGVQQTRL